MIEPDDWRLYPEKNYLKGVALRRQTYRQYPDNPNWDHDHCSFCMATFTAGEGADDLHEGYCTEDEYYWVCEPCFLDFRDLFSWNVIARSA